MDGVRTIRNKILGSLLLIFSLSLGATLFGMWKYQQGMYLADTRRDAELVGRSIETLLQYSMLHNDHQAIQPSLERLRSYPPLKRISIVNTNGVVASSSDTNEVGKRLPPASSSICQVCHLAEHPQNRVTATLIADSIHDNDGDPYLRTVIPIANHPPCHGCHPRTDTHCGLGMLVLDYSLRGTFEVLRTVASRAIITGCGTFLVIMVCISWLVTRFISRPLDSFMEGIRQLEAGNFNYWVEVRTGGELAEMADSFNVMSRALGRYISEVGKKNHEIGLLFTIVEKMSETVEWKKIKGAIVNLLLEILAVEGVLLVVPVEGDANSVEIVSKCKGDKRQYLYTYALNSSEDPHKGLSREKLLSWYRDELAESDFGGDCHTALVPLRLKNVKLGLICLSKPQGSTFTPSEKEFIPEITHKIAVSFGYARLFFLATTDELTGLNSRHHFHTILTDLIAEFRLTGERFSLLTLVLDQLPNVYDTYGHSAGDHVLQELTMLIRGSLRHEQDIACRHGDDGFLILLPSSDLQYAILVAERLRKAVANHIFEIGGFVSLCQTISIGIANCPLHAVDGKGLIEAADAALHLAKESGLNQAYYLNEN